MMIAYLGFDDTDTHDSPYGTGKVVRWFQNALPDGCACLGIVRQQLFVCDDIPYTSHNSAACLIAEIPGPEDLKETIERAVDHIERHAVDGSDPGLCAVIEDGRSMDRVKEFGYRCTRAVSTQKQALRAVREGHLSGHGGTNDGIIGAAAAVGLTASGWSGRFIEFGALRNSPDELSVSELGERGIAVISMERDAGVPAPGDTVATHGWLRPRLIGHQPVLFVRSNGSGRWENVHRKRKKAGHGPEDASD